MGCVAAWRCLLEWAALWPGDFVLTVICGRYGLPVSWVTTALVTSLSMAITELGGVALSRRYGAEQRDFTLKNLVVVGAISLFQLMSKNSDPKEAAKPSVPWVLILGIGFYRSQWSIWMGEWLKCGAICAFAYGLTLAGRPV